MLKRVRYGDVSRCTECAENFPLLLAFLGQVNLTTSFIKTYYECGSCATELTVDWGDSAMAAADEDD